MARELGAAYLLDERIGSGASGEVWRGHLKDGGDPVAVKMLKRDLAEDREVVNRFLRERDILVGLDHPNVVSVIDLVAEGGRLGIVMQLVAGGDLRQHLEQAGGTLSPEATAALLAQVAAGLAAAHAAGVVHRDLKPENVLVDTADDGSVVARITDFGVAYLGGQPALTRSGGMIGTPLYAAPEVTVGSTLTPAADVYALGVIAYELVSGRPPFDADNPWALMRLHVEEVAARPANVPDALWDVISSCLDKDPGVRPTAAAVADTFLALSAGVLQGPTRSERQTVPPATYRSAAFPPVEPPPPPGPGFTQGSGRRRWVPAVAIGAIVLLVGLGGVLAKPFIFRPDPTTTTSSTPSSSSSTTGSSITSSPPPLPGRQLVSFTFDDLTVGPMGSSGTVPDASGNGNAGNVRAEAGGRLNVVERTPDGNKAVKFPEPCPPAQAPECPRAIIQTPDPSDFVASGHDLAYGTDVLVQRAEVSAGAVLLHKGRVTRPDDGELSLQLEADGRPSCVAVPPEPAPPSAAVSSVGIADGGWHQVTCTRTVSELRIDIDGGTTGRVDLPPGLRLESLAPLRLGGNSGQEGNAQFSGTLDNVFFRLADS